MPITSYFTYWKFIITTTWVITVLITVAEEEKPCESMQRKRPGPNAVGYYGLLQAFADALKTDIKRVCSTYTS